MELISIFLPLISFFFCLSFFKILNPKIIAVVSSSLITIAAFFSIYLLHEIILTNLGRNLQKDIGLDSGVYRRIIVSRDIVESNLDKMLTSLD